MNNRNIEKLVHRILSGKQIIAHKNNLYELRQPSIDLKIESDLIYEKNILDNIYNDFILEEDKELYLITNHIISSLHSQILKDTESKLEDAKVRLFSDFIDLKKRKYHKTHIAALKKTINTLISVLHSIDFLVLENFADNIRHEFIISKTLYYYQTNNLVFNSGNIDYVFFNEIAQILSANIIELPTYKIIARSDYWRNYYSNKNNLFPYSAIEYTDEQKALMSISSMYEKVYEHPECPDEQIIQDDDALDGWMILQQKQNKKQKQEKGVNHMMTDKIRNSSEIFLMAGDNKEQARSILDLNSKEGLQKIQNRINAVSGGQSVKESELPDVRQELRSRLKELNRKK